MKKDKKLVGMPEHKLDKALDGMFDKIPVIVNKAKEMNNALKKAQRKEHVHA